MGIKFENDEMDGYVHPDYMKNNGWNWIKFYWLPLAIYLILNNYKKSIF